MHEARDPGPGRRTDARRNRRRLLEAAREVMREQGLDASLGEIARRAAVGAATLYRHFPSREALCEAVFAEYGNDLERIGEQALQIPDPWDALTTWLEQTCAHAAGDRAFADLVTRGMPRSPALNDVCLRAIDLARTLFDRAQRAGAVRPDVELTDVLFVVHSLQRTIPATAAVAPDVWRRYLAIALDGLRPREGSTLPSTALTLEELIELGEREQALSRHPAQREGAGPDESVPLVGSDPCAGGAPAVTAAISDELWELIEPELTSGAGGRGRPRRDHRRTLEAVLWRYRTGCPWRDLPAEFGPWQTLWKRHRRWSCEGVYQRILERVLQS